MKSNTKKLLKLTIAMLGIGAAIVFAVRYIDQPAPMAVAPQNTQSQMAEETREEDNSNLPYINILKLQDDIKEKLSKGDYQNLQEGKYPGLKLVITELSLKVSGKNISIRFNSHYIDLKGKDLSGIPGYSQKGILTGTINENGDVVLDGSSLETYTNEKYKFSFKYEKISTEKLICPDDISQTPMKSLHESEQDRIVSIMDCNGLLFVVIVHSESLFGKEYKNISENWEQISFNDDMGYLKKNNDNTTVIIRKNNNIYEINYPNNLNGHAIMNTFEFR